ncbi:TetR/AcrR family transcriptional regulator [Actinotalea solisilvae]|uniref:TetR/AcrR family transcriptional regulator n=1 Tax=Actinotalea solisilvae TaxID=2072922 RepID=UPI001F167A7A|nr:TetR/AcrR family transcriptional regulator [Actinotalea solisilvae]
MPTTTRDRILEAATRLLDEGGPDAMSTRAVSAAARVQAPAIYRLFRDKQGLLDAVTERGFEQYVVAKTTRERAEDPVDDLRRGWDLHLEFGLTHPAVYTAIYGVPRPGEPSPAVRRSDEILLGIVRRIAAAGRLRVDEATAARVVQAAGRGTTLLLLTQPPDERDLHVAEVTREAVVAAITTDAAPGAGAEPVAVAARTLTAALPGLTRLTEPERALLAEWLGRIAEG